MNKDFAAISVRSVTKGLLLITLVLILVVLTSCSSSSVVGTWYLSDLTTGKESTIQFDSDKSGRVDGIAFTWKDEGGVVTMTSGTHAAQMRMTDQNTLIDDEGDEYYRDYDKAREAYETVKYERIATASAEKEMRLNELTQELTGTWYYQQEISSVYNINYTNEYTSVFNNDGTWTQKSVVHEIDFGGFGTKPQVIEKINDSSGTWEIGYDYPSSSRYASADEECLPQGFYIKFTDQNGANAAKPFFVIKIIKEKPQLSVTSYEKQ